MSDNRKWLCSMLTAVLKIAGKTADLLCKHLNSFTIAQSQTHALHHLYSF